MSKNNKGPKGPDNNHDYQRLVAEESAVRAYLEGEGVDLAKYAESGGTPIAGLLNRHLSTVVGHDALVARVAELEAEINAGPAGGNATDGEIAAIARAEAAEKALGECAEQVKELDARVVSLGEALEQAALADGDVAELQKAQARIAELEAQVEQANSAVDELEAAKTDGAVAEAEPEGPREGVECGEACGNVSARDLNVLIEEGAVFDFVFSDGDSEILEFERKRLNAVTDLVRHGNRYMIEPSILISGPRTEGASAIHVAGGALLANGEQVGFCAFDRPIVVNPGDQRQFNRAFLFG